jgi:hypothetical protein
VNIEPDVSDKDPPRPVSDASGSAPANLAHNPRYPAYCETSPPVLTRTSGLAQSSALAAIYLEIASDLVEKSLGIESPAMQGQEQPRAFSRVWAGADLSADI